jgi:hypothetical protein
MFTHCMPAAVVAEVATDTCYNTMVDILSATELWRTPACVSAKANLHLGCQVKASAAYDSHITSESRLPC